MKNAGRGLSGTVDRILRGKGTPRFSVGLSQTLRAPQWAAGLSELTAKVSSWHEAPSVGVSPLLLCVVLGLAFAPAMAAMGQSVPRFLRALPGVMALALLSYVFAAQASVKAMK